MEQNFLPVEFILSSTIQVGIAIAGFTGIVLALSSRRKLSPEQLISISILLISSIASVTFAFIPMLLLSAHFTYANTWAISSLVFLIYFMGILLYRRRQFYNIDSSIPRDIKMMISLFSIAAILQIPNIFYFREAWPFLILLISYILYSFSVFVDLLRKIWDDDKKDKSDDL